MFRDLPMKRASLHSFLYVIILIIALIMIIVFLGKSQILMNDKYAQQQCSADLKAAYMQNTANSLKFFNGGLGGTSSTNLAELRCDPKKVTIKGANKDKIKRQVADQMLSCWNLFERGKINLFSNDPGLKENYCIICSYIEFEKKGITIDQFTEFLLNNRPVPNDAAHPDATYFKLFYGNAIEYEADTEKFTKNNPFFIDTNQKYMTMFTYWKTVGTESKANNLVNGAVSGAIAGGTTAVATVIVGTALGVVTGGVGTLVAFIAVATMGSGAAYGIATAVDAPWDTQKQWTAGIFFMPIDFNSILQKGCTKLGQ